MSLISLRNYRFRKLRVRTKVDGSAERPRLSVYRSLKHIYAQIIDDATGKTLASCSTLDPELAKKDKPKSKREAAQRVGQLVAERAKAANIRRVVFDRGGRIYHGRVKAVADGAREGGLEF